MSRRRDWSAPKNHGNCDRVLTRWGLQSTLSDAPEEQTPSASQRGPCIAAVFARREDFLIHIDPAPFGLNPKFVGNWSSKTDPESMISRSYGGLARWDWINVTRYRPSADGTLAAIRAVGAASSHQQKLAGDERRHSTMVQRGICRYLGGAPPRPNANENFGHVDPRVRITFVNAARLR